MNEILNDDENRDVVYVNKKLLKSAMRLAKKIRERARVEEEDEMEKQKQQLF